MELILGVVQELEVVELLEAEMVELVLHLRAMGMMVLVLVGEMAEHIVLVEEILLTVELVEVLLQAVILEKTPIQVVEVMSHNLPAVKEKMAFLAEDLRVAQQETDTARKAKAAIHAVRDLTETLEVRATDSIKVDESVLDTWISEGMEENRFQRSYSRDISSEEMKAMLGRIFM